MDDATALPERKEVRPSKPENEQSGGCGDYIGGATGLVQTDCKRDDDNGCGGEHENVGAVEDLPATQACPARGSVWEQKREWNGEGAES